MGEIISATTRFVQKGGKGSQFLAKAHVLMNQAMHSRRDGDLLLALEFSYQAALRTAGAVVAMSPVAARKRKPRDAWSQLRLVDAASAAWAEELSSYSRIRARAASGLDVQFSESDIDTFMERVDAFLESAESAMGWNSQVA